MVTAEAVGVDRVQPGRDEMDRELQAQHLESDQEAMTEAETDLSG